MSSKKSPARVLTALALAAGAMMSQAHADAVIGVTVSANNPAFGSSLSVDVVVSGLTQAVGAYSFTLNYDPSLMALNSFTSDPDSKMGNVDYPADNFGLGQVGSSVNFDMLAGFFGGDPGGADSEAALYALQGSGAGFRLGHLDFTVSGPPGGLASLTLTGFSLGNFDGLVTLASSARNAQVCVGGSCSSTPIPEPSSMLLLASALAALAVSRRKPTAKV